MSRCHNTACELLPNPVKVEGAAGTFADVDDDERAEDGQRAEVGTQTEVEVRETIDISDQKELCKMLIREAKCCVCSSPMTGQIIMCRHGHNLCGDCKERLESCPTCSVDWTGTVRNRFLERNFVMWKAACGNKGHGCPAVVSIVSLGEHEATCEWRETACPFDDGWCKWRGSQQALEDHKKTEHPRELIEVSEHIDITEQLRSGAMRISLHVWMQDGARFKLVMTTLQRDTDLDVCLVIVAETEAAGYVGRIIVKSRAKTHEILGEILQGEEELEDRIRQGYGIELGPFEVQGFLSGGPVTVRVGAGRPNKE